MSASGEYLLGLDLGGTRLKALCTSLEGEELDREVVSSAGDDWQVGVGACVEGLRAAHGEPQAIGVAAPGLAAADERSIAVMPGRLAGLEGLDWGDFLGFSGPMRVLNDAHAALLGEVWRGSARGLRDVVMLTLGTGVGGAIFSGGKLLRGHLGRAGHLGHVAIHADGPLDIVNTPGSLEDAVGDHTIARRSGGRFHSTHELVVTKREGDGEAEKVWAQMIRDLAAGVTSLINVLDPEAIVLGGGIAQAGEDLFQPLAAELDRVEWRPTDRAVALIPAALGEWAGAFGAAYDSQPSHPSSP